MSIYGIGFSELLGIILERQLRMEKEIKIFYSWQSDLPKTTNRNGIEQSIRIACNQVEVEIEDTSIIIDQSTSNVPGSPNIPETIFKKTPTSSIFICDLSTINSKYAPKKVRRLQNPNVLIELGYAVAHLGWNRILILFNEEYGKHSDLPFDIDRHRANNFLIKDKSDNDGKNKLAKLLSTAIKSIIIDNPKTPMELKLQTPKEREREITVNNLEIALSTIHIPTFDNFLEFIPRKIIGRIFFFQESFFGVVESSQFYLYDKKAKEILKKFKNLWDFSLGFDHRYNPDGSGENYNYYIPADVFPDEQSKVDFDKLTENKSKLKESFLELLDYIRENYIEINIDKTSEKAFVEYRDFKDDMTKYQK